MLSISELLSLRGLDPAARVKLLRHQSSQFDMDELHRRGLIEVYQSYQSNRKVLRSCETVVSFLGAAGTRARFYGVYRVLTERPARERPLSPDFPYLSFFPPEGYHYDLERLAGFEDLENRVIIDWGSATRSWFQWMDRNPKEVIEILPTGYVRDFPGYFDFVLSFEELKRIVAQPDSNREWHRMLSAVAGVYLVTDLRTGMQYVGSASGTEGIMGRWISYARDGHGGNAQLRRLVEADPSYMYNFQYTVLRTLPQTLTRAEVIRFELLYKTKLGTRAFGLNSN